MSEKRRFIRFNVFMDALCRTKGALKKMKVDNFCRDGVGILSSESLTRGDDIEVEMLIPGDNVPIMFEGKVAWTSSPRADNASHKSGVKFKKISNEDRGRLLEHIYEKWVTTRKEIDKKKETEEI